MAVSATWYGPGAKNIVNGNVLYLTNTIKVMLMGGTFAFSKDDETRAQIVANEIAAGNGYTARGATLGTKSVTYDAATDRTRLFAANTVWTPSAGQTLSAKAAVIYKDTGTDSTSYLMGCVDFGTTMSALSGAFTLDWDNTEGLLYVQA
jgi:hypothetical protein